MIKDKVAILMPCAGAVDPHVMLSLAIIANTCGLNGIATEMGIRVREVIHSARNHLVESFLKSDCEWAFWMDSDMLIPPEAILMLLKYAKAIPATFLSGVYYQRGAGHKPLIWRQDVEVTDPEGRIYRRKYDDEYVHHHFIPPDSKQPFVAHVVGFGCVLTHRSLFEQIAKPWFKWPEIDGELEASEDFYFCVKARKAGFKLWVIPELSCGHIADPEVIGEAHFKRELEKEKDKSQLSKIAVEARKQSEVA